MSIHSFLTTYGYLAVFLGVTLEYTGIPFPGETMLIAAGVYAASGHLEIGLVIAAAALGSVVGGNLGYVVGHRFGRGLVVRYGTYVRLDARTLRVAERFFAKHGDKTIVIARFVTVLRTWVSFLAGVHKMPLVRFEVFNAFASIAWAGLYGIIAFKVGEKLSLSRIGLIGLGAVVLVVIVLFILHRMGFNLERVLLGNDYEVTDEDEQQHAVPT